MPPKRSVEHFRPPPPWNKVEVVLQQHEILDPRRTDSERVTWADVNLYHLNDHFVKPLTSGCKCSFVELMASGPQLPR